MSLGVTAEPRNAHTAAARGLAGRLTTPACCLDHALVALVQVRIYDRHASTLVNMNAGVRQQQVAPPSR